MSIDPDDFGWHIDLENEVIHFQGGFSARIVSMLDEHGFDAEHKSAARIITVEMPPDSLWVSFDLRAIDPDDIVWLDGDEPVH